MKAKQVFFFTSLRTYTAYHSTVEDLSAERWICIFILFSFTPKPEVLKLCQVLGNARRSYFPLSFLLDHVFLYLQLFVTATYYKAEPKPLY